MTLKANQNHEVTIKLGDDVKAWTLERRIGTPGGLGIAGDTIILLPGLAIGGLMVSAGIESISDPCSGSWCFDFSGLLPLGLITIAVTATPVIVDGVTNEFYELVPKEITAEFE